MGGGYLGGGVRWWEQLGGVVWRRDEELEGVGVGGRRQEKEKLEEEIKYQRTKVPRSQVEYESSEGPSCFNLIITCMKKLNVSAQQKFWTTCCMYALEQSPNASKVQTAKWKPN